MRTILIVEDDPAITKVLSTLMGRLGHRVVLAGDGEEGVTSFDDEAPDLVVLDVGLPRRTGFDVLGHIRAGGPTPVIMLTALVDRGDRALAAGADAFLTKPFDIGILASTAQRLLNEN